MAHQRRRRLAGGPRRRDARRAGPGRHVPVRRRGALRAGAAASCGASLVTDEIDDDHRLLQALNCLLIETPVGSRPGRDRHRRAGRRQDAGDARLRGPGDRAGARDRRLPARDRRRRGDEPPPLRPRRRPAAGRRRAGLPARDDRRPAGRVGGRARRQPAARRLLRPAGADAGQGLGRRRAGPTASRSCCPGVSVVPTGGHSTGHQAIVVRGSGDGAKTLAFFGDLFMRPVGGEPALGHRVRRLPARLGRAQGRAVRPGRRRGLARSSCRTSASTRSAGSCRDRDRFRFEPI